MDHETACEVEGGNEFDPKYHLTKGFSEFYNPFQHKPDERLNDKVQKQADKLADLEEHRNKVDGERKNQAKNLKMIEKSVYFATSSDSNRRSPSLKAQKPNTSHEP